MSTQELGLKTDYNILESLRHWESRQERPIIMGKESEAAS